MVLRPSSEGGKELQVLFIKRALHPEDPWSGDDWTPVISAGDISWTTDSYSVNPDANAIRWGTLYNFRFTCTASPASGSALIGLFKPGNGPDTESVSITTPGGGNGYIDCNGNGIPDTYEIARDPSLDLNHDGILDMCQ